LRHSEAPPRIALILSSRPSSRLQNTLTLIRSAQDGDRAAFESLFERYYPRVRGIVRARAGPGLRQAMETGDILQCSMIEAIRSFEDYQVRGDAGFIHWFAGIVQNRIRAASRDAGRDKRDRGREVALDHILGCMSTGSLSFEPAESQPLPVEQVAEREREELVAACLHELKEKHREVVLLRCYAGASWKEAAEILGCSTPDAARVLYYRATRELKQAVERKVGT
jgi:RNA polymerase sigma-70 factor (subfamily 1)